MGDARRAEVVLFDLDGTLTDPGVGITRSLAYAFETVGMPVPDDGLLRSMIGPPLADAFASAGLDAQGVERAIDAYRERYTRRGMFENALVPGIPELLRELRAGGVLLAVATSKPEPFALTIVEHFGLEGAFSVVAGATLDHARRHKEDVVRHALEHFGLPDPSDVVMVGDREHDVFGAAAHGIDAVGVLWGYGSRAELESAGARSIVETVEQLQSELAVNPV